MSLVEGLLGFMSHYKEIWVKCFLWLLYVCVCPFLLSYLEIDNPGHNQCGHQKISNSQADNQVVGSGLQSLFPGHSHAHQNVAEDDDEDE